MNTRFIKINDRRNAEPNAPAPIITRTGDDVVLEFDLNPFQFKQFSEGDRGRLIFRRCWRYRLDGTNDERFSKIAPAWGEFYEVLGDLKLESAPHDVLQPKGQVRYPCTYSWRARVLSQPIHSAPSLALLPRGKQ